MKYKYAFKTDKENVVKVVGRDLGISTKQAIEVCSFIKGKSIAKAKGMLGLVKEKKLAVPYKRFTNAIGHKKGMAAGRYPLNTSDAFLTLLNSLEANAQNKGLGTNLTIIHACAQEAARPYHYGRRRRVKMKRSHVELAAQETEAKKPAAKPANKKVNA
jgi:large subunit ribosomal protein L22